MASIRRWGNRIRFSLSAENMPLPDDNPNQTQKLFDWLQRVHQGEEGALSQFLMLCQYRLMDLGHGYSQRMKGKENTPDLVQESLIVLYDSILKHHFADKDHLEAFLRTILNNAHINRHRHFFLTAKRGAKLEHSDVDTIEETCASNPVAILENAEELEQMAKSLKILNEKELTILKMRHQENQSWAEIGWVFGMTANAARKAHDRILGVLRSAMGLKVKVDWIEKN